MDTGTERFGKGHRSKIRLITIGLNGIPIQGGLSTKNPMELHSRVSKKKNNFTAKENKSMDHDNKHDHGKENVEIIINDTQYEVHRGHHTVAELKTLAGIPLAYDLNIVNDGKFEFLQDDSGITIKGDEKFISNPKDGASS